MFLVANNTTYTAAPSIADPTFDDQELIERIIIGDQEAMTMLHARYVNLVYSVIHRIIDDSAAAEECVQDTFLRVWQSAHKFDRKRGPFVPWMVSIARNLAIDKLRQYYRRIPLTQPTDEDGDLLDMIVVDWPDRERISGLRLALEALPSEQRQVLELSYYGGMSQSDIAASCALPLGTVKTRMRLAMQKLRDAWLQG